jgi:hypothetical protein
VSAFLDRASRRLAAGAISFLAFGLACATGTQGGSLSEDTLRDPASAGTNPAGGSTAGGVSSGGTSAGTTSAGTNAIPMAGTPSAGASAGGAAGSAGGATVGGSGGGGSGGTAGAGGAGGTAGGGGMAGSGGAASSGFRYAKLVALSEQAGAVWSSCAELQIMTTGNLAINRAGWAIVADSQETNNEPDPATAAIDGNTATFWHTSWAPPPNNVNDAKLPHYLMVDLITAQPITGFSYLPRQTGTNGHIKDWEFYLSKDALSWGTAVKTGTFPNGTALQTITF